MPEPRAGSDVTEYTTIDDLASFIHSPRHVGHLPIGAPVLVLDPITGQHREVTLLTTIRRGAMVLVLGAAADLTGMDTDV